jgi:hypothetical protein
MRNHRYVRTRRIADRFDSSEIELAPVDAVILQPGGDGRELSMAGDQIDHEVLAVVS